MAGKERRRITQDIRKVLRERNMFTIFVLVVLLCSLCYVGARNLIRLYSLNIYSLCQVYFSKSLNLF